jgi:hypothetical protein
MNRRKAIFRLLILGGGTAGVYGGIKGYHLLKQPELDKLTVFQPLIDELAETIIPRTDTPGAKDAGVGLFITKMVKDCTGRRSQNNFINGLDELAAYTALYYGRPFQQCSQEDRNKILGHYESKGKRGNGFVGKAKRYVLGDSFFQTLKNYTVLGFCTSKAGVNEALSYDYVPGSYTGCTTISPGQKAWATW